MRRRVVDRCLGTCIAVLVGLLALALVAPIAAHAEPIAFSGTITDSITGQPLGDAFLYAFDLEGAGYFISPDANGAYEGYLPAGTYTLSAYANGYSYVTAPGLLFDGENTILWDFALEPLPVALSGIVTDSATGEPVEGAEIDAQDPDFGGYYYAHTLADGSYQLRAPAGTYDTSTYGEHYFTANASGLVFDGTHTVAHNIELIREPVAIRGVITDSVTGDPISGAYVYAEDPDNGGFQAYTDETGAYECYAPAGTYEVNASADGYNDVTLSAVVFDGTDTSVQDLELAPYSVAVRGTITDSVTGDPINGAYVYVSYPGGYSTGFSADEAGGYECYGPAGTYGVQVSADGYTEMTESDLVFNGTDSLTRDFAMESLPIAFSGTVTDIESGDPVANPSVNARNIDTDVNYYGTSDSEGRYEILAPAGTYHITTDANDYESASVSDLVFNGTDTVTHDPKLTRYPVAIRGTITDSLTGEPIAGANVYLSDPDSGGRYAYTDSNGVYRCYAPAGTYTVTAHANGYAEITVSDLGFDGADSLLWDFALEPLPIAFRGTVTDSASGMPIQSVQVSVRNIATGMYYYAYTDADGGYELQAPSAIYDMSTYAGPYQDTIVYDLVFDGVDTVTRDLSLTSHPVAIRGTITDSVTGEPISDAYVYASDPDNGSFEAHTDETGSYECFAPAGTYALSAQAQGYGKVVVPDLEFNGTDSLSQDFVLEPLPVAFTGFVTDIETGEPVAYPSISARNADTGIGYFCTSNADGSYELLAPAGTYDITAGASDYDYTTEFDLVFNGTDTVTHDPQLTHYPVAIRGTLADSVTGMPISGAYVSTYNPSLGGRGDYTDETGAFEFYGPAGTYTVTTYAYGYTNVTVPDLDFDGIDAVTSDLTLTHLPSAIRGTITDSVTGESINGAHVFLEGVDGDMYGAYLDEMGVYECFAPAGTYTVTVSGEGYADVTETDVVFDGTDTLTRDFTLESLPMAFSGTVTDSVTGMSLDYAEVRARNVDTDMYYYGNAEDGSYTLLAPAGTYDISASAFNYESATASGLVFNGTDTVTHDLTLTHFPVAIRGTITDSTTGKPIAGVYVYAQNDDNDQYAYTDEAGVYECYAPAGTYEIHTSVDGYASGSASGVIVDGEVAVTQDFDLAPLPIAFRGTVTDSVSGEPIVEAYVRAFDSETGDSYGTETDSEGRFVIRVSAGDYDLSVDVESYGVARFSSFFNGTDEVTHDFALVHHPVAFRGTLTDIVTGEPIVDGQVSAYDGEVDAGYYANSDEAGNYVLYAPAGTYALSANARDYADARGSEFVFDGTDSFTQDFALSHYPTAVRGRITDRATGNPIAGAYVYASVPGEEFSFGGESDEDGNYVIYLPADTYALGVRVHGFERASVPPVVFNGSDVITQDFALVKYPTALRGTVTDSVTGNPVSGAEVYIVDYDAELDFWAETNELGVYEVFAPAGTYDVEVSASAYQWTTLDSTVFNGTDTLTRNFVLTRDASIFVIAPSAGANGEISPGEAQNVSEGSDLTFTVTPDAGYHIDEVLKDGESIGASSSVTFSNVGADHTISATFAINTYTLTPTAGANGTISPAAVQTADWHTSKTFTISPNAGYHLVDVLKDGASIGASSSVTFTNIAENHTLSATFAINTYRLTPGAVTNGTISPAGEQIVNHGGSRTFTITPATNYRLSDVRIDGASIGASSSVTLSGVSANHTIDATFELGKWTVTPQPGANGAISPSGVQVVSEGSARTFTVTPNTGYHILDVKKDGVSIGASSSVSFSNIAADHTLSATFAVNTHTLTASAGANGVISPVGVQTVDWNTSKTFTITPNTGYHLVEVLKDGVSISVPSSGPLSVTFSGIAENHTLSATFAINTYTLSASSGANGAVSPAGAQTVNHGAEKVFTITPNAGYHVADVLVDGVSRGAVTSFAFTGVNANHTISATFAADVVVVPPVVAPPVVTPVVTPTVTKPKVTLTNPVAPGTMYKGKYKSVIGYLKPRHTAGSTSAVLIYRYKKNSKGVYVKYDSVRAKLSNYSTYSKYTKSLAFPSKGKWRIRAYAPADSKHSATWSSSYDYVTVK